MLHKRRMAEARFTQMHEMIFERLEDLLARDENWGGEYEGVCIHISDNITRLVKLPYPPVEIAQLDRTFRLRPAADAIEAWEEWLVLHISLKSPRLFLFDGEKVRLLGEVNLPDSVFSFSDEGVLDGGKRAHVRRARGQVSPQLASQGMSSAESPRELNEPVFMREVAHAIEATEEAKRLPLLVIGGEKVVPAFLKSYQHQGGEVATITNARAHPDERDIARMCASVAWKKQQKRKSKVLDDIKELCGRDGVFSNNVREIYEASTQGRVAAAVVACDEEIWCRIDPDQKPRSAKPDDENAFEVLDRIYLETLLKEGRAIVLPEDEIPGGKSVAAVLRW